MKVRATFVQRPLWMLTEMAHHERAASFCVEKCRERSEGEAVGPPSALVFKGLEINVMLGWRPLLLGRGTSKCSSSFLFLVRVVRPGAPLVASLLLVAMPFVPSSEHCS